MSKSPLRAYRLTPPRLCHVVSPSCKRACVCVIYVWFLESDAHWAICERKPTQIIHLHVIKSKIDLNNYNYNHSEVIIPVRVCQQYLQPVSCNSSSFFLISRKPTFNKTDTSLSAEQHNLPRNQCCAFTIAWVTTWPQYFGTVFVCLFWVAVAMVVVVLGG